MNKRYTILLVIVILISTASCSVRPSPAQISQVSQVYTKDWYSGYLDFTYLDLPTHMHYFYFPSQSSTPEKDPLLFWFNGGPGCSSLLGALYEHGPFIYNDAFGFLMNNPESWNKRANTVYIESPSQVGFSYMDIPQGGKYPTWTDDKVAKLNMRSVLQFFLVFTEYIGRETFIAGQSYGGIYVPTLANEIHEYNKAPTEYFSINFKGFAVGNGCTDVTQCNFINDYPKYQMYLFRDLGYITDDELMNVQKLCASDDVTKECQDQYTKLYDRADGFNIYDAYRSCWQTEGLSFQQKLRLALRIKKNANDDLGWSPPCVDSIGIDNLLKSPENRKILGIPDNVDNYSMCNNQDNFGYDRSANGSYWVYEKLLPLNKYKIVIYSGDSDPAVPIAGTLMWMVKIKRQLSLASRIYWRPWMTTTYNGKQNSGSIWAFENKISLVRFKGVGHMAPQWNNEGGTKMINYFMFDEQM